MTRKILRTARLIVPYTRLALKYLGDEDVWNRTRIRASDALLGAGRTEELGWYLTGESSVDARTVAQVCRWLRGCSYVTDERLFQQDDFWQHPCTFEQIRRGDCDDHSVWAWRKLVDLGFSAELCVGNCLDGRHGIHGLHAWVLYHVDGEPMIMETVAKRRKTMLKSFRIFRDSYIPHFSIDPGLRVYMYAGYVQRTMTRNYPKPP